MIHTLRNLLILSAVFFVIAVFPVKAEQRDSGAAEPKTEAKGETLVPRSWWLAERRKRKRLARYSVRVETQRNKLRAALRDRVTFGSSALVTGFLCIHRFEGSWTDPNAPYYGGLQMDDNFMESYGHNFYKAWGSADHWPAFVQVAVALNAHLSGRGYKPWPNTARYCGLL